MEPLKIRSIPTTELNPAAYNPRKNLQPGDPEYEKLLRSVDEFGYVEPIVWNEKTGNIVGGHQRFKILKQLGNTEIECVVINMDAVREKALNIALNKIQGEFDVPKLTALLQDLEKSGFRVDITGFEAPDLAKMYQQLARTEGKIVEDNFDGEAEAAKITEPVTKPGDIWLLGNHRLMCGDSTDIGTVARLMDGVRAKMTLDDPPWGVSYGSDEKHPSWKSRQILNDNLPPEEFYNFLLSAFKAMASMCEAGAMAYVFMSAQEWASVMTAMKAAGFHWSSTIIWVKDRHVLSRKDYNTRYEPIWYGWFAPKGEPRLCRLEDKQQNDVWEFDRPAKSPDHPMMKPIALMARMLSNSSYNGDAILDLFGGSGTVLLAAEQTERVCYTMELDPKYCDVITKRYRDYKKSDSDIFLLRDGQRTAYREVV